MDKLPTIHELFGPFWQFIHGLKNMSIVRDFNPEEIEERIFFYDPKEALTNISAAINTITNTKQSIPEILESIDIAEMQKRFKIKLPTKVKGWCDEDEVGYQIDEMLSDIVAVFYRIEEQLNLMLNIEYKESNNEAANQKEIKPFITIDEGYEITDLRKINETILDIYQTALMFEYFKECNIIQHYDATSLARVASILTGHSENNLRKKKGFGAISSIKKDEAKNKNKAQGNLYNLNTVKKALEAIIEKIDKDIELQDKVNSKKL